MWCSMTSQFSGVCALYFFWGLFIANNVIYKSHISEIYRDEDRIKYYSILALTYGIALYSLIYILFIINKIDCLDYA